MNDSEEFIKQRIEYALKNGEELCVDIICENFSCGVCPWNYVKDSCDQLFQEKVLVVSRRMKLKKLLDI